MERKLKNDTSIRIADTVNNTMGKVFECNVNMSVSLSNGKRSKILQRTQSLLIVLLTVTFLVVFTQLKREVRVLEEQMISMNSNMAILMLRYEKLNRNINRMNHRKLRTTVPKIHEEESMNSHKMNANDNDKSEKISNEILLTDEDTLTQKRFERSIVMVDNNNVTEVTTISTDNLWNDSRSGRSRREEVRGKQRRKMERRPKGSRRRLGPLVATFVGAVPEQHVTDTGSYIGPWVKRNETRYGFNKFHLVEDKKSIEVTANGLYMISVQIYYFGEKMHYSYWILLSSEGSSITRKVIKCATLSAVSATEASCYTSIILPLRRGDRLHVQQQERNRLINLREGHSYIQVMLLSSDQQKRRLNT